MTMAFWTLIPALLALALAQDPPPVYRAASNLVLVDAQVIHNRTKTSAPPLERRDLEVYEDGVLQEIKYFSRDELPVSVVLLFDLTGTSRRVLWPLAAGAKNVVTHFKPQDEVAVMAYLDAARLIGDFTTDRRQTVRDIDRTRRADEEKNTAAFFNEAVYQAAMHLRSNGRPGNRRVIIWLTDNLSNVPDEMTRVHLGRNVPKGELHTEQEARRALHEAGIMVAPLLAQAPLQLIDRQRMAADGLWAKFAPPGDARKYAEWTGGQVTELRGKGVDQRLADLIDELRSTYTIGFQASEGKPAGTFCKLRVTVAPNGRLRPQEWNVLARDGYYRK